MTNNRIINKQVDIISASNLNCITNDHFILETAKLAFWRLDVEGDYISASQNFYDLIGIDVKEHVSVTQIFEYVDPGSIRRLKGNVAILVNDKTHVLKQEISFEHPKTKKTRWLSVTARNAVWDEAGRCLEIVGVIQDITEQKEEALRMKAEHQLYQSLFKHSPTGIFLINENGNVLEANNAFYRILKLPHKHTFNLSNIYISDAKEKMNALEWINRYGGIRNRVVECELNGNVIYMDMCITKSIWGDQSSYDGTISDISERIKIQNRNHWLVNHDSMTGLYNRFAFEAKLFTEEIKRPAVVVLADVDGLKLINDAFGHAEGDKVLVKVADSLKQVFPEAFVARIGGDEFAAILENVTKDNMEERIEEFARLCAHMYHLEIRTGASVGHAYIGEHASIDEEYCRAENMMYRKKLTARSSRKSNALTSLITALNERTPETKEHCENVAKLSRTLLMKLGQRRKSELSDMSLLATLHDIGKLTIPFYMLRKNGTLNGNEWAIMRQHCEAGFKIASNMIEGSTVADGILYHHEHWDGNGYPYGLSGERIPLFSRIIAVADAYDVMTRPKPYGKLRTREEAIEEIKRCSGKQFDPKVVDALLDVDFDTLDI